MTEVHIGRYYQHRYGGIYHVSDISFSTVDQSKWVVYAHVFPFEYKVWHRPYDEFIDGRFRLMERDEYSKVLETTNRTEFQKVVTACKEAAKKDK